jgi:hypothetical protein
MCRETPLLLSPVDGGLLDSHLAIHDLLHDLVDVVEVVELSVRDILLFAISDEICKSLV